MTEQLRSLSLVLRRLRRAPFFTSVVVFTLAVGIGANAAIFSVLHGVLLRPLPYPHAERLVGLSHAAPGINLSALDLSPASYTTYRDESRTLDGIGVWRRESYDVTGQGEPERVAGVLVTERTLPLLGFDVAIGRGFTRDDMVPGAAPTVLVGHDYWRTRLGSRPDVIGQSLRLDGVSREVIGVLQPGVVAFGDHPAVVVPAEFDPVRQGVGNFSFRGFARLRDGATVAEAKAELDRLTPVMAARYPGFVTLEQLQSARFEAVLTPLKDVVIGDVGPMLWILFGTAGVVLLIACANVANLFLVQAEGRHRELALRTAMGARWSRLVGGFLGESLVLSGAGAVLGLFLAWGGLALLRAIGPDALPRMESVGLSAPVLGFTVLVSVLSAAAFGAFPALRFGREDLQAALRQGGRAMSATRERLGVRNALVAAQVALALVLLISSGLMVRTLQAMLKVDPGFASPEQVVTFQLYLPQADVPTAGEVGQTFDVLAQSIQSLPGIRSVSVGTSVPFDGNQNADPVEIEGRPLVPGELPSVRWFEWISGDYFSTLQTPLAAGRALTWDDTRQRARHVMVSENLARTEWGSAEAAIGKRLRLGLPGAEWYEVVGVARDIYAQGVHLPAPERVFFPLVTANFYRDSLFVQRGVRFLVRTEGSPLAALPAIEERVRAIVPNVPLASIRTLEDLYRTSMSRTSFTLVMLGVASAVALVLGLVGVYGVISYVVQQRTREIGVRLALGAPPGVVKGMILRQAAAVTGAGLCIGLLAAALATRMLQTMLYGVAAIDPVTFLGVAVLLGLIALGASYLPARRAARVDPLVALRAD